MLHLTALPLLACLLTSPTQDPAWPEYRGPAANGSAPESNPPLTWSEEQNIRWKTPIHGRGWSTPVVIGDRVWLTTASEQGHELSALALDLGTGDVVVDRVVFEVEEPEPRNRLNSYASPSPVAGGGRVYVNFGTYGLACLDAKSGETVWGAA